MWQTAARTAAARHRLTILSRPSAARSTNVNAISNHLHHPRLRHFTQKPSLLLISRTVNRPQLPFLHPPTVSSRINQNAGPIARYLSTERKARWKATLRWQLRFHAYFWPSLLLVMLLGLGMQHTRLERDYPTPREWTFWSRWNLRTAKHTELDEEAKIGQLVTNWGKAGRFYLEVIKRLENESVGGSDAKNLIRDEETLVEGVGRTGLDISAKSEEWRRGYHEALMGAARAAEHLEGMARKKGEDFGKLVSWDSVIGPTNPRPKPMPWDKDGMHMNPPKDEEMEDAFASPEVYYMKVLTTVGFNARQRLDAAIDYADWCDFKGLKDTAGNMYDWALDIAAGALPEGANNVVDITSGVINKGKEEYVSENILRATTAMGVHFAKQGDVKQALPIFLSILRARRALPALPIEFQEPAENKRSKADESLIMSYLISLKDLVVERPYPRAPASGNERPFHTLKEACEEVGLMTYIGEILFATSDTEREKGLSWTRDSVGAAEAVLWVMDERQEEATEGRLRCRECLETGLENWKHMARQMVKTAKAKQHEAEEWKGILGTGIGKSSALEKTKLEVSKWEEEEDQIKLRKQKTVSLVHPLKPRPKSWLAV